MRDLEGVERIHLMGLGGAGMSSLAKLFLEMGATVSGCDLTRSHHIDELDALGAEHVLGHSKEHLDRFAPQLMVYSSAIDTECDELVSARARGIRTVCRGEALSWLFDAADGVGVAGTHGKTTTSSMIGLILSRAGLSPTLYVGAEMRDLGTSAIVGEGRLFVSELDESDGSFELFHPALAVVTNVDHDHVDRFASKEDVVDAFVRFASGRKLEAPLVVCGEDDGAQRMLQALARRNDARPVVRYGWGRGWEWGAFDLEPRHGGGIGCTVCRGGKNVGRLELAVSGEHNVLNALAALAASSEVGVSFHDAAETLRSFHGAERRLQVKGERDGVLTIDDYAHHPAEVAATLSAVRGIWPDRRILLVFQPHRYSRTAMFTTALASALGAADAVLLLPIYSAGEQALSISSEDIADEIRAAGGSCIPCVDEGEALDIISARAREGDVLLTMGAGDVFRLADAFLSS